MSTSEQYGISTQAVLAILAGIQILVIIGVVFTWVANMNNMREDTLAMRDQYIEMKLQLSKLNDSLDRISNKIDKSENQILLWLNKANAERAAIIILLKDKYPEWTLPISDSVYIR